MNMHGDYGCGALPDGSYECECGHCGGEAPDEQVAWEWRAKHPQTGEVVGPWIPCGSVESAERARACGYEVRAKQTFPDGFEKALHDAYAEGRKDQSEVNNAQPEWLSIETAPEDTNILVATTGGHVDTAFWTDEDGEGRKWWWLESANKYAPHPIHPDLVPTHWMPLPKHPEAQ
jgi:hypothetical protein